jgi:hypothetical protein
MDQPKLWSHCSAQMSALYRMLRLPTQGNKAFFIREPSKLGATNDKLGFDLHFQFGRPQGSSAQSYIERVINIFLLPFSYWQ